MLTITQGLPFTKLGAIRADGGPTDATGWTVSANLRSPSDESFNAVLSITWIDQAAGSFQLDNVTETSTYPIGRLILDVRLTGPGGEVIKAYPEPVQVEKF